MGHHEDVFQTIAESARHGGDAWWLWAGECEACHSRWLIAQDDRISDAFFMRRLTQPEVVAIEDGGWPSDFLRYEDVLALARERGHSWTFLERLSPALLWTTFDLATARADIDIAKIAYLLNVDLAHANELAECIQRDHGITIARGLGAG